MQQKKGYLKCQKTTIATIELEVKIQKQHAPFATTKLVHQSKTDYSNGNNLTSSCSYHNYIYKYT